MIYFNSNDLNFNTLCRIGELNTRLIFSVANENEELAASRIIGLFDIAKALKGDAAVKTIASLLDDILKFGFKLNPKNKMQVSPDMYSIKYFEFLIGKENYQQCTILLSHAWKKDRLGGKAEADRFEHALFKAAISQDYFALDALVINIVNIRLYLEELLKLGLLDACISLAYAAIKNEAVGPADHKALIAKYVRHMFLFLKIEEIYEGDDARDELNQWLEKQFDANFTSLPREVISRLEDDANDAADASRVEPKPYLFEYLSQRDRNVFINLCYKFSKSLGKDIRSGADLNISTGISASLIISDVDNKLERLLDHLYARIDALEDHITQAYQDHMNRSRIRYMPYTNIDILLVTFVILPMYIDQAVKCMGAYCVGFNSNDQNENYLRGIKEGCYVIKNNASYCDIMRYTGNVARIDETKSQFFAAGITPLVLYFVFRMISLLYLTKYLKDLHNNFQNTLQVCFQEIEEIHADTQELHELVTGAYHIEEFDTDEQSLLPIELRELLELVATILPSHKLKTNVDESLSRSKEIKASVTQVRATLFSNVPAYKHNELQTHPRVEELEEKYMGDASSHSESGVASDDDENRPLMG